MSRRTSKTDEAILILRQNIALLRKAKKNCRCDVGEARQTEGLAHYHVLINHDLETGDEYFERYEENHKKTIQKWEEKLRRLEAKRKGRKA